MNHRRAGWAAAALSILGPAPALAKFATFPEAPVARLLANVTRELAKSPNDPHLLYLAGRTHAIAYAQGEQAAGHTAPGARDEAALPVFGTKTYDRLSYQGQADETRLGHLREGIRLLRRAADLAKPPVPTGFDERPLLYLGLAWLLDDGSRFAAQLGHPLDPPPKDPLSEAERGPIDAQVAHLGAASPADRAAAYDALRSNLDRAWARLAARRDATDPQVRTSVAALLTQWWRDQALDAYRRAFDLAKARDAEGVELFGTFTVSREAGQAALRLFEGLPRTEAIEKEREAIVAHLARLDHRGQAITPVLFPIPFAAPLGALLPTGRTARFDLVGDGVARRWPWPSPAAGFLVWTPSPDAPVDSGRRMFGSRTWWIGWRDGYEPLSMLDDDGDGRLSGAELEGVGVWRDADGDGRCDPGEVLPAATFGVAWIRVRPTRLEEGVPAADEGLGLADGSTRPTYDWTPTSLPEPTAQP